MGSIFEISIFFPSVMDWAWIFFKISWEQWAYKHFFFPHCIAALNREILYKENYGRTVTACNISFSFINWKWSHDLEKKSGSFLIFENGEGQNIALGPLQP